MDKKPKSKTNKGKNVKKFNSYSEAYKRIIGGIKKKYYFEAITIEESIITDRLISNLYGRKLLDKMTEENYGSNDFAFSIIINKWRDAQPKVGKKNIPQKVKSNEFDNLIQAVDTFREMRNKCIHGFVKTFPGKPTSNVDNFIEFAELTAKLGYKLCRAVEKYHAAEKKKYLRSK